MSSARLESLGEGRFRVSGVLDASTAGDVLEQSESSFSQASNIEVDWLVESLGLRRGDASAVRGPLKVAPDKGDLM